MWRHCRDTLQVHPWKLGHDVHVIDGHGRIYTRLEKHKTEAAVFLTEHKNLIIFAHFLIDS
ncbi:hypothetical protein GCM10007978_39070 [Shewanella hanedai]|nr:hypothetical protein GCM10007978_39070 [Shewanella hanedai]